MKKNVIVFTGAGISQCSGVSTFRDNNGLWENHNVEDVCSPKGFKKNPKLVWSFYKQRFDQLKTIWPNAAHLAIANLQQRVEAKGLNFILVTQNVDNLHQAAYSKNVHELHGNLNIKCDRCEFTSEDTSYWDNEEVPSCPSCGHLLRPNIVWFGEMPNEKAYHLAMDALEDCHSFLVVGTSCQVYPAAQIAKYAVKRNIRVFECNIKSSLEYDAFGKPNYHFLKGKASVVVPEACNRIYNKILTDLSGEMK